MANMIRSATAADARAICAIYNPYIAETTVTFEEQTVTEGAMRDRIADVTRSFPWLVSEQNGVVVGYAYATQWRIRPAYRFSSEMTVYVQRDLGRRGIGLALYSELIKKLRDLGMHRTIGGIALPNAASVALHEKLGFKKVAHFGEVGFKLGRWIDVGYWQLEL